ncbi:MAG TPA: penicillin-binding protein 2 [Thermoanaerobaculia bacterium]|nr:penicillin-binding protein 2 [Thermoanaerobaculia bacterium]
MKVVREYRDDLVGRVRVLAAAISGLLVAVGAGFWFVQIAQGDYYRELAENNRLRKLPITAPRGLIYDRRGRLLVENLPSYNLMLDRSRCKDLERSLEFAAAVLGRPLANFEEVLERYREVPGFKPVLLAENLTLGEVARIGVKRLEYPEFEVEVQQQRLYRHREQAAHAIGYIGEASLPEIVNARGALAVGDLTGKKGVEKRYDPLLRGKDGERVVVVDSRGQLLQEYGRHAARPGQDLVLTIDLDLQQEAARWLDGPDKVGAIIAMDPRNGEILALVSSPAYNSNLFARRLQEDDWQALLQAPNQPLENRALQNAYSPGSTFKIVLATAGLSEHLVDESFRIFCTGSTTIYNHPFRCWRKEGHGWVDIRSALERSCDVFFYHLGQRLGIERIARYARLFGLGAPTGIDIPGEKEGLIPDSAWSLKVRKMPWYPGETISVAIGQGPVLLTPLQSAVMTAVVANGGYRVAPHLVKNLPAPAPVRTGLDPRVLRIVREGLWSVVNSPSGTAYATAHLAGAEIAGKTGSVQVIAQKTRIKAETLPFKMRDHGWFTSFAPAHDPRLVVTVFVEHGGSSHAAAPIAKALYEKYFGAELPRPATSRLAAARLSAVAAAVAAAGAPAPALPAAGPEPVHDR